jgi:hypothetical protein
MPHVSPNGPATNDKLLAVKIETLEERERLRQEGKCLRCRRMNCPGASGNLKSCTVFSEDRPIQNRDRRGTPARSNAQKVDAEEESTAEGTDTPVSLNE